MIENKKSKSIISLLFEILNRDEIPYAVLRNYETLPEKLSGESDVDILIDESYQDIYLHALNQAVKKAQAFILAKKYHFNCLSYFIYQTIPFLFTWIDAFTKIATKSFIWADSTFLLQNRIWHKNGFYILSPGSEAAILLLKEPLLSFPVKEKYRLRIQNLIKGNEVDFLRTLSSHFNKKIAQEILQIAQQGKWEELFKKRKRWWRVLILNKIFHQPIEQLFLFFKFLWGYTKDYFRFRKGASIAFLGPDGVGKTTISQAIKKKLENFFPQKIYYYRGRFGFFPELNKIYNFFSSSNENSLHPTEENLFNRFRALLHLLYYGLEAFLSWPWFFWGKIRGKIFLFDRYFYDYLATSIHRQIPSWLFFFIANLIPRPHLTFIIYARPEEIYKRKKEWPIEEISKQLQAFQSLQLLKLSKCILIDNEKPLEENLNKIEKEILKSLEIKNL